VNLRSRASAIEDMWMRRSEGEREGKKKLSTNTKVSSVEDSSVGDEEEITHLLCVQDMIPSLDLLSLDEVVSESCSRLSSSSVLVVLVN